MPAPRKAACQAAVAKGYGAHQEILAAAPLISAEMAVTSLKLKPRFFG